MTKFSDERYNYDNNSQHAKRNDNKNKTSNTKIDQYRYLNIKEKLLGNKYGVKSYSRNREATKSVAKLLSKTFPKPTAPKQIHNHNSFRELFEKLETYLSTEFTLYGDYPSELRYKNYSEKDYNYDDSIGVKMKPAGATLKPPEKITAVKSTVEKSTVEKSTTVKSTVEKSTTFKSTTDKQSDKTTTDKQSDKTTTDKQSDKTTTDKQSGKTTTDKQSGKGSNCEVPTTSTTKETTTLTTKATTTLTTKATTTLTTKATKTLATKVTEEDYDYDDYEDVTYPVRPVWEQKEDDPPKQNNKRPHNRCELCPPTRSRPPQSVCRPFTITTTKTPCRGKLFMCCPVCRSRIKFQMEARILETTIRVDDVCRTWATKKKAAQRRRYE